MNSALIFCAMVAFAAATPIGEVQFSEDTRGNYALRYETEEASRHEERFEDGKTIGTFRFVDPEGHEHSIKYVAAAEHGFEAEGADVPVSVVEGADIANARINHLNEYALIEKTRGVYKETPIPVEAVLAKLVKPEIDELPSIAVPDVDEDHTAAKIALLEAYDDALRQLAAVYKQTKTATF